MQKIVWATLTLVFSITAYATCDKNESGPLCNKTASQVATSKKNPVALAGSASSGLPPGILRAMQHSQDNAAAQAKDFAKNNPQ